MYFFYNRYSVSYLKLLSSSFRYTNSNIKVNISQAEKYNPFLNIDVFGMNIQRGQLKNKGTLQKTFKRTVDLLILLYGDVSFFQ
jgi:hypothetical protein